MTSYFWDFTVKERIQDHNEMTFALLWILIEEVAVT